MLLSALDKIRTRISVGTFAARLAVFNASVFFVIGIHLPYMPLWLSSKGMGEREVAIIMATPQIARLGFTPLISFFADRSGDFRAVLRVLSLGTCLALLVLALSQSFAGLLTCFFLYAVSWTTIIPLTEAIAMKGVREDGHNYGRMRLWGSLSFICANAACGAGVQVWGAEAVMPFILAAAACLLAASFALPEGRKDALRKPVPHKERLSDAAAILGDPAFWVFLAAASATQAAHGLYYTFASIHWEAQQYPGLAIGGLWTLGVIAEILLFAYSGRVLVWIKPSRLILLGASVSVVRWAAMALEPPLALLFPLQLLHAFTFGATHLGAVHFINEAVPERHAATAQGLYSTISGGLATGLMTLASGPLYRSYGSAGFWAMAALAVAAALCAVQLDRLSKKRLSYRVTK